MTMAETPTPRPPIAGGSAAVIPLAAALLPLVPGLVQSVMGILREIQMHATTPDEAKTQLDAVIAHLDSAATKVAAVQFS
jgi:hypothetical protein